MASPQIIVLITGGNNGIGFETAKNLVYSSEKYHILLGSRDVAKGEAAVAQLQSGPIKGTVSSIQIDVTSDKSVDAAAEEVIQAYGRLDVLVNNAGIFSQNPVLRDAFREVYAVNLFGVVSTTEAFLPALRKSSEPRLVFVSSSTGSISILADPTSRHHIGAGKPYRSSKAALNFLMVSYWIDLQKENFKVFGADPGLNATNLMNTEELRQRGAPEPYVGGERVASVIRGDRDEDVGKVCGEPGTVPW
ncbi:hypothetical protein A1O3_04601 [Capronia epimyces CBS 606.96]|uniref:Uncharacterized protein n=1 Tax=Capronia epimyces CBS 606.96 TaxID=1182542 RepID=W9YD91_9EURO|nr:uncharacterized protein A1O3_04601 [Capronia epimyces CBS 606.96]EXJ87640.1 hypothetical protein A1O3_04601 [Capronia epimyces CBS 606.96]